MPGYEETLDRLGALVANARSEKGQTLIEYLLIIVVVALAIIFAYETANINNTISETLVNLNLKINHPVAAP